MPQRLIQNNLSASGKTVLRQGTAATRVFRRKGSPKAPENFAADVGSRHRPSKEISLHLIRIDLMEECRLLCGLNPLNGYPHIQFTSQRDNCLDHRSGVVAGGIEFLHETAIDLDLVEREAPQDVPAKAARPAYDCEAVTRSEDRALLRESISD
jgi:hypothetical protein